MIDSLIRQMAVGMAPGEDRGSLVCPFCQGGRHQDKAFSISITDDGDLLYKCHRASCDAHGIVRAGVSAWQAGTRDPARPAVTPPGPTRPLSDLEVAEIYELYEIEWDALEAAQVMAYDGEDIGTRVVIPIEGPAGADLRGYLRGYEYRLLPPYERRDKTRHYRLSDGIWAGVFGRPDHGLVVVEDVWSAIKVAQELPGIAGYSLMGTHMTVEHVMEINRLTKNWYLCLDKDASLKAIKYQQKYRHLGRFQICLLDRDLKYLDAKEISEVLR